MQVVGIWCILEIMAEVESCTCYLIVTIRNYTQVEQITAHKSYTIELETILQLVVSLSSGYIIITFNKNYTDSLHYFIYLDVNY